MALTRQLVDEYLEKGMCPTPEGTFVQDRSGLVININDYKEPFVPVGKLKNRLKYNPLNQILDHYYVDSRPESFLKLCMMKPFHYANFVVDPFIKMMDRFDADKVSGYSVLTADKEEAAIIPILIGNKNAMTLGFFWNNSHVKHRKLCIGIKAQYNLIKHMSMIGIEQLYLRGGHLQYKLIFDPVLKTYEV